jgi:hypothetical protein
MPPHGAGPRAAAPGVLTFRTVHLSAPAPTRRAIDRLVAVCHVSPPAPSTVSAPTEHEPGPHAARPVLLYLAAALLHFAAFDLRRQPIATDVGFFLYFSAETAHGAVPYRDYFEHKTPLSILTGAALHRVGEAIGIDPLHAVRAGFLVLAAAYATLSAVTACAVTGRAAAGWIVLLALAGFPLLGLLPATGTVPKLLAMLGATAAALAVHRRHWVWAGICAAGAAMDWQPGGALAGAGVLLAGWTSGAGRRSAARALLGMALGAAPVIVYLAVHGALAPFLAMTVGGSLGRAAGETTDLGARLAWIRTLADLHHAPWLTGSAILGLPLLLGVIVTCRGTASLPPLVHLGVYHGGIVAFSLLDFQGLGDLFVLDGTLAMLAALPPLALVAAVERAAPGRLRAAAVPGVAALLALVVRPSFLDRGWRTSALPPIGRPGVTLAAQRQVARRFVDLVGAGRAAVLRHHHVLVLGPARTTLPFAYWNAATWAWWRRPGEDATATIDRLLRAADPDAVLPPPRWAPGRWTATAGYRPVRIASDDGRHAITVWLRPARP